ncbi:MAG: hypothetical protein ACREUX_21820 [Burkholderiales bacterium]
MNTEYRFRGRDRRRDRRDESQRSERLRFLGSAIGLWAVCATGIYLIGPGDVERMAAAGLAADSIAPQRASIAVAAYQP